MQTHRSSRRSERTPDYSTWFSGASTKGRTTIDEFAAPQSVGRCLAARPSASSAEAPQATTTARVNTGEKPRRLARVTMRRGPCRRTSASAMTRLTGGVRSVAGIGARIETQPFPSWFGKRGCSRARPRDAGRSNCSSRPSAYDPSGHIGIWQYPFEPMRDIPTDVSAPAAPRRGAMSIPPGTTSIEDRGLRDETPAFQRSAASTVS